MWTIRAHPDYETVVSFLVVENSACAEGAPCKSGERQTRGREEARKTLHQTLYCDVKQHNHSNSQPKKNPWGNGVGLGG